MTTQEIIKKIVETAENKKGFDITTLDLRKSTIICDYFIIITASSKVHSKAICEGIEQELKKNNVFKFGREGYTEASWILLDYGKIIAHIFTREKREFYDLEGLWKGNFDNFAGI